jgi:hypothetical protein
MAVNVAGCCIVYFLETSSHHVHYLRSKLKLVVCNRVSEDTQDIWRDMTITTTRKSARRASAIPSVNPQTEPLNRSSCSRSTRPSVCTISILKLGTTHSARQDSTHRAAPSEERRIAQCLPSLWWMDGVASHHLAPAAPATLIHKELQKPVEPLAPPSAQQPVEC